MSAIHPSRPSFSKFTPIIRIGQAILLGGIVLIALANVYLGFPHNIFAPQCNGAVGSPCLGCACSPTPSWTPPIATLVLIYPLLSALLLLASILVAVLGFVYARREQKSHHPLLLLSKFAKVPDQAGYRAHGAIWIQNRPPVQDFCCSA
jgi:hypothetical protein